MTADLTDHILAQGRTTVRAIEALGTIHPRESFDRALALWLCEYRRNGRYVPFCPPPFLSFAN